MLHVGGVHDATTEAPPAADAVMVPVIVTAVTAPATTLTDEGCDEDQLSGTPVMTFFMLSVTVAVIVWVEPCASVNKLPLMPLTDSEIDWTGQVTKLKDVLFTDPTLANMLLTPGSRAVA